MSDDGAAVAVFLGLTLMLGCLGYCYEFQHQTKRRPHYRGVHPRSHARGEAVSHFTDILTIGFDKNGEADFRCSMYIAKLSQERFDEFLRMVPIAISEAVQLRREHGPGAKDMAACKAAPPPSTPAQEGE